MKQRIIAAILGIALFIPFVVAGGYWFAYAVLILGLIALTEMAKMQKINYFNEIGLIAILALASILLPEPYLSPFFSTISPQKIFFIAGMLLLVLTVYRYQQFNFVDASTLIFASLYIGFGFRYLILIRELGLSTFLYLMLVVWSTDSGAYFIGKRFGRHKLAPQISPNKTIEGAVGGVLTALFVTSFYLWIFPIKIHYHQWVIFLTVFISLAGQFGDLVESAYKRYFGVKDSGTFLPGHGGVLDRFDSTLFASVMFVVWNSSIGI